MAPDDHPANAPAAPTPPPVPTADGDSVIDTDVRCCECGYLLRGLRRAAHCPECSADVLRSIMGSTLEYRNPRWVRTIRSGFHLLLWGLLATFIGQVVGSIVGMLSAFTPAISTEIGIAVSALIMGLCLIPVALGVWRLTTADPAAALESRPERIRQWARWLMFLQIVMGPAGVVTSSVMQNAMFTNAPGAGGPPAVVGNAIVAAMIGGALATIFTAAAHAFGVLHVRELASQIPRDSETKQLGWCFWIMLIGNVLQVISTIGLAFILPQFIQKLAAQGGNQGAPPIAELVKLGVVSLPSVIGGLAVLTGTIWVLVILILLARAMTPIVAAAERHHANPHARPAPDDTAPDVPPTAPADGA